MTAQEKSEQLARAWIDGWNAGKPDDIPLNVDFRHTSPFGTIQGKDHYLEVVKPMAAKNVNVLNIKRVLGGIDEATIWFEMDTPNGIIPVCEWITLDDNSILSVDSFYDPATLPVKKGEVAYD